MSPSTPTTSTLDAFLRSANGRLGGNTPVSSRDTVESWLLGDPQHFDVLLEQHWPKAVRGPAFARTFYWELLHKHRPDLLARAIGLARTDPCHDLPIPDWHRVVRDLVDDTDFGAHPDLAGSLDDLATHRVQGSALGKIRYQLARQVIRVALGDYLSDEERTTEHDARALRHLLALGYGQHIMCAGEPLAMRNIVHVLVEAGGGGFASRQEVVRKRFATVLDILLASGVSLAGGPLQNYPQLVSPLEMAVARWIQATDEEWQQTNATMAKILMEAGAPWELALEVAGPESEVGQEIIRHPVVRRERMLRQLNLTIPHQAPGAEDTRAL